LADSRTIWYENARACVVEKEQQRAVPQGKVPVGRQSCENVLDLITFEKEGLWGIYTFCRDRRYLLRLAKPIGQLAANILEEGPQCRQPMIAASNAIGSFLFK